MNRKRLLTTVALCLSPLGFGLAMPSCPGQQVLQQQIDAMQASTTQATQKVNALDARVKTLENEIEQMKQLAAQVTTTLTEQKTALDAANAAITEMKAAKPAPAPARGAAPKKRGR